MFCARRHHQAKEHNNGVSSLSTLGKEPFLKSAAGVKRGEEVHLRRACSYNKGGREAQALH